MKICQANLYSALSLQYGQNIERKGKEINREEELRIVNWEG